jgi:hypothetical protein
MPRIHKAQTKDRPKRGGPAAPSAAPASQPIAHPASLSRDTILMLQRARGNHFVQRAVAANVSLSSFSSPLQRMQTPVPAPDIEAQDDTSDTDVDGGASPVQQQTPPQSASPHDQKVAADLAKLKEPGFGQDDLDPALAAQALAGLGLEEAPEQPDEIAEMEEMLRTAIDLGIDAKSLQAYKKHLQELKLKRLLSHESASPEEMSSVLEESEKLGLPKALLDPLRFQVLALDLQKRCGALRGQVQPLQTEAQQLFRVISPLNGQINQLHSIVIIHPRPGDKVIGCQEEAADLQQQLRAAHQDFQAVIAIFDEIVDAVTVDLPTTLPALRKRESSIKSQENALEEQKPKLETAKSTHKAALATGGAVSDLSNNVTLCFQDLCSYYVDQEPYVAAYNAQYGNEFGPYMNHVVHLRDLNAQPLTLGSAKQIVKAVTDADFTVQYDAYLKTFTHWFGEYLSVPAVMTKMLIYKKEQFATYPTKGRIGIQYLLGLGHIELKHKGTYRDTTEKGEKKGQRYGPFSRSFWVTIKAPKTDCDWVIHVHYHSNDPAVIDTPGNIDKMHAKTKENEKKKGGALADWTNIQPLQALVSNTAKNATKDKQGHVT